MTRIAAVITALSMSAGCAPQRSPTTSEASGTVQPTDPGAAMRGEYLFNAAGCVGCHTDKENGGARLAGGRAIETPFGAYFSRNITPDPVHGIGAWSDADFLRALRRGIAPDGAHYFSAFPFPAFTGMTDRDILDIKAYLFTQKPEPTQNKPTAAGFPFNVRVAMVLWRALYFTPGPLEPDPAKSTEWNRGAYLVKAVSHCGECHTPRTALGGLEHDRELAGARLPGPGDKRAPNITPDATDGTGSWTIDDAAALLKIGIKQNGDFVGEPMSDVVEGTGKLSDADRRAIAVYLKSVPAVPGKGG
jgi:mono/diheme cytochrome c family protein